MGALRCVHLNRRLRCGDLPATAVTKICLMDACFAQPTSYPPGRQPWPRWPTMSGRRRLAGAELGTGPNCRRENCKARAKPAPTRPIPWADLTDTRTIPPRSCFREGLYALALVRSLTTPRMRFAAGPPGRPNGSPHPTPSVGPQNCSQSRRLGQALDTLFPCQSNLAPDPQKFTS